MPFRNQDAAAERRQQLAAQLLRGEAVAVNQQGAIVPINANDTTAAAIQIPEGKLASSSLYWYERDPELFEAELGAMQHFFPQFRPDRLEDGRMAWFGALSSGIPGSDRQWFLQLVYDHDHPHADNHGGSISVFPVEPNLASIAQSLGEAIPHTLVDSASGELSICTVETRSFRHGGDHSSTAASSLAWAAKWIASFELWMLGELSTSEFAGHRI
jgi:hypothetical protein